MTMSYFSDNSLSGSAKHIASDLSIPLFYIPQFFLSIEVWDIFWKWQLRGAASMNSAH